MKLNLYNVLVITAFLTSVDLQAGLFARSSQKLMNAAFARSTLPGARRFTRNFSNFNETQNSSGWTNAKEIAKEAVSGVSAGIVGTSACLAAGSALGIEEIGMVGGLVVGPWAALVVGGPVGAGAFITTGAAWVIAKELDIH